MSDRETESSPLLGLSLNAHNGRCIPVLRMDKMNSIRVLHVGGQLLEVSPLLLRFASIGKMESRSEAKT